MLDRLHILTENIRERDFDPASAAIKATHIQSSPIQNPKLAKSKETNFVWKNFSSATTKRDLRTSFSHLQDSAFFVNPDTDID